MTSHIEKIHARLDVAYAGGGAAGALVLPCGSTNGWQHNDATGVFLNLTAPAGAAQTRTLSLVPQRRIKLTARGTGEIPWKAIAAGTGAKLVCTGGIPDATCVATP